MKKLLIALVVLAISLAMAVPAFAADTGSLKIEGITTGDTYYLYRLFDVHVSEANPDGFALTCTPEWLDFFQSEEGKAYATLNDSGAVMSYSFYDYTEVFSEFIQLAANYQAAPVASSDNGQFTDLPLGAYLVAGPEMNTVCFIVPQRTHVILANKPAFSPDEDTTSSAEDAPAEDITTGTENLPSGESENDTTGISLPETTDSNTTPETKEEESPLFGVLLGLGLLLGSFVMAYFIWRQK